MIVIRGFVISWLVCIAGFADQVQFGRPLSFRGICDASAAEALTGDLIAVADDEDNAIRVYSLRGGGEPLVIKDLSEHLLISAKSPEADLEGAARIGDRIYWISSHGRNRNGKERPNRGQFFATAGIVTNGLVDLRPIGHAYHHLLSDLLCDPRLAPFGLAHAAKLAPKTPGALNIEGLAATTNGHLLIGFRNPIPRGKALVVPLTNPGELIALRPARFGEPILLDLQGLGIRGLTSHQGSFLIIAGSTGDGGKSRLFSWRGGQDQPQLLKGVDLLELNPEAIASFSSPNSAPGVFLASDDGALEVGGTQYKKLKDPRQRSFRALTLMLSHSRP